MKRITYQIAIDTAGQTALVRKSILCTEDSLDKNESLATLEAYNGEITVTDDDEAPPLPSDAERLDALEAAVLMLMGGM